jgi:hypothetical protein
MPFSTGILATVASDALLDVDNAFDLGTGFCIRNQPYLLLMDFTKDSGA